MNKSVKKYEEVLVDDQLVLIPSSDAWDQISNDPLFLGMPIYSVKTRKIFDNLLSFTRAHSDRFTLGLYRAAHLTKWMLLPLFRCANRWQRVQIECINCRVCGWAGAIANATEPSLYFGLSDELEATRRALALPRLACPSCGSELTRHAIWTGERNTMGVINNV